MSSSELVLCVSSADLHLHGLTGQGQHALNQAARLYTGDKVQKFLKSEPELLFLRKKHADKNENYQQIIPYIICMRADDDDSLEVLRYERSKSGGEDRLHGLLSIGIGGHINQEDWDECEGLRSLDDLILQGAKRELLEELDLDDSRYQLRRVGIVRNLTDEVGRVHTGIVLIALITDCGGMKFNDELHKWEWISVNDIAATVDVVDDCEAYETWSQIIITQIAEFSDTEGELIWPEEEVQNDEETEADLPVWDISKCYTVYDSDGEIAPEGQYLVVHLDDPRTGYGHAARMAARQYKCNLQGIDNKLASKIDNIISRLEESMKPSQKTSDSRLTGRP